MNVLKNFWVLFVFIILLCEYPAIAEEAIINETNFPDEKFREFVKTKNKNNDGILSSEEIAAVTKIEVNSDTYNGLANLKGIEFFTELTSLNMSRRKLSSVNLTNNTKLTELICNECDLEELDVSNNTQLVKLNCSDNKLTCLDLSKNTALQVLTCERNYILSLDLTVINSLTSADSDKKRNSKLSSKVSGDKQLTYSLTTGDYKYMFDLKTILPDNYENISSVNAPSFDKESCVAYFTSKPTQLIYNYDTNSIYQDTREKVFLPVTINFASDVVPAEPIITTESLPDGTIGTEYSQTLTAEITPDTQAAWSIASGNLPDNLNLDSTGTISGTPTKAGVFNFTVKLENSGGNKEINLSIKIRNVAPVLADTNEKSVTVTAGQNIETIIVTPTNGTNITWETSGELPTGLTVSSTDTSYTISGTTNLSDANKNFTYTVTASNDEGQSSQVINFTVNDVAPIFETLQTNTINIDPGQAIQSVTIRAASGTNLTWTHSGNLPSGLSGQIADDKMSYTISGTPNESAAGKTFEYTVTATNNKGHVDKKITFKVYDVAPSFSDIESSYNLEPLENKSITLTASTGTNIQWSTSGTLPSGMTGTGNGMNFTISGMPAISEAGKNFSYTVTAANNKASINKTFTLNVLNQAPVLDDVATVWSIDPQVNTTITLNASKGTNLTWTASGNLPSGLSGQIADDNMSYTISGTPANNEAGKSFTYTVQVANTRGTSTREFTINVYDIAPTFSEINSNQDLEPDIEQSITLTASTGTNIQWTTSGTLPSGMTGTENGMNFTISGTPAITEAGKNFSYTVTAANNKASINKTFTLNVLNQAPVLDELSQTLYELEPSQNITPITVTATSGTNIQWLHNNLPSGLSVENNGMTFTISGAPEISTAGQEFSFTITAKNNRAEQSKTLTLKILNAAPEFSQANTNFRFAPNKEITPITFTLSNGTNITSMTLENLPTGLTGTPSENNMSFTISGTPDNSTAGKNFTCTLKATNTRNTAELNLTFNIADIITTGEQETSTNGNITTITTKLSGHNNNEIGSVEIKIEVDSDNITTENEKVFSKTGSLDVNIILNGADYDSYSVSMDVTGLDWLTIECESHDKNFDITNNTAASHHSFTFKGTPSTLNNSANVKLIAYVTLSEKAEVLDPLTITAEKNINFKVTANLSSLEITTTALTNAIYGEEYNFSIKSQGAYGNNISWSLAEASKFPEGLTLDNNGKISGVPTKIGTFAFTIKVTDTHKTASKDFTLIINDSAIELTGDKTILTGTAGQDNFTATITASKGTNILWSSQGTLPKGLSAISDGDNYKIFGIPDISTAGTKSEYTITASNSAGQKNVTIAISILNVKPELDDVQTTQNIEPLKSISDIKIISLQGTNLTWQTSGALPSGLTGKIADDNKSFTITGTPNISAAGKTFDYTVTASNDAGNSSRKITFNAADKILTETSQTENGGTLIQIKNINGISLGNINVTITLSSSDITAINGAEFSQSGSVDVNISLNGAKLDSYVMSFDVKSLPSWLICECSSEDSQINISDTSYQHSFTLKGTPDKISESTLNFLADVLFTGSDSEFLVTCSRDAKLSVTEAQISTPELVSLDVKLSGNTSITIEAGESETLSLTASVNAIYSDFTTKTLDPEEYNLTWSTPGYDPEIYNMTFADGVLTVKSSAKTNSYNIPVRVIASIENISGQIDTSLNITITNGKTKSVNEIIAKMTSEEKQQVTTLKINSDITDLSGLETLTNLQSIDLTENTAIEDVNLNGNTSIKAVTLTGNQTVKTINMINSKIETVDAQNCKNLIILNLSSCDIKEIKLDGCESLQEIICDNNKLVRLDLYNLAGTLTKVSCAGQHVDFDERFNENFNLNNLLSAAVSASDENDSNFSDNIINVKAYDMNEKEISCDYDQATGEANFETEPAVITYDYITGYKDVKMDVTIYQSDNNDAENELESAVGGCKCEVEGVGFMTIIAVLSLIFKRSR